MRLTIPLVLVAIGAVLLLRPRPAAPDAPALILPAVATAKAPAPVVPVYCIGPLSSVVPYTVGQAVLLQAHKFYPERNEYYALVNLDAFKDMIAGVINTDKWVIVEGRDLGYQNSYVKKLAVDSIRLLPPQAPPVVIDPQPTTVKGASRCGCSGYGDCTCPPGTCGCAKCSAPDPLPWHHNSPQPDPFGPEQHVARTDGQPDIVVSQNCDCKSKASCTCDQSKCKCLNCSDAAAKAKPTSPNDILDQRSLDQGWIADGDGQTSVYNPRTGQRYFWGSGFEVQQQRLPVWRPMPMQQSFAPMIGGGGRGGC